MPILHRQRARERHVSFDQVRPCGFVTRPSPCPQLPHNSSDDTGAR
jgi:hypothetical protein